MSSYLETKEGEERNTIVEKLLERKRKYLNEYSDSELKFFDVLSSLVSIVTKESDTTKLEWIYTFYLLRDIPNDENLTIEDVRDIVSDTPERDSVPKEHAEYLLGDKWNKVPRPVYMYIEKVIEYIENDFQNIHDLFDLFQFLHKYPNVLLSKNFISLHDEIQGIKITRLYVGKDVNSIIKEYLFLS